MFKLLQLFSNLLQLVASADKLRVLLPGFGIVPLFIEVVMFGIDSIDIYQFHAVSTLDELSKIFSEKGALRLWRCLILTQYLSVYAVALAMPRPEDDFRPVLKVAMDRGIGATAVKSIAMRRPLPGEEKKHTTWYKLFGNQEDIDKAI